MASGAPEGHITLQFPFRIQNRFDARYVDFGRAGLRPQKRTQAIKTLWLGHAVQHLGIHEQHVSAVFRRSCNDGCVLHSWLVAEPGTRSEEYESENNPHHHVILPTGTRVVPQDEALEHLSLF